MIKASKPKTIAKPVTRKTTKKVLQRSTEASSKSTKHSTPACNTPTGKQSTPTKPEALDLSLEADLSASAIIKETQSIKSSILDSLKAFKALNSEYISKNLELQNEVDTFHENFSSVKNEVNEILWESTKSKEEVSKIKNYIEIPKSKANLDFDMSSVKSSDDDLIIEKLNRLKGEINDMRRKIEGNEFEIKRKDTENSELRSAVFRLRDSLMNETLSIEGFESQPACSGCYLF